MSDHKTKFDLIRHRLGQTMPCPHDNLDTRLGNGAVWAKCLDCGDTIQQSSVENYSNSSTLPDLRTL